MLYRRIVVLLLLAWLSPAGAEPRVEVLSKAQGLPSPYARSLVRLPDGSLLVAFMGEQGVGSGAGTAWIHDGRVTVLRGPSSGLRSDHVTALGVAGGAVWAASDRGLHRFDRGRFEPVGPSVPLEQLSVAPDGALWAAGESAVVRVVGGQVKVLPPPARVRRLLRLLAVSASRAWLVAQDAVLQADAAALRRVPLEGSPLHFTGPQRGERRMPPFWLFDAALGGDGRLYVVGATRRLVAFDGRRFDVIADGFFSSLSAVGDALYATAHDDSLRRFDTSRPASPPTVLLRTSGGARLQGPWADAAGAVWVVVAPADNQGHTMTRIGADGAELRWPLSRGTYLSPGVLQALPDGQGGLWMSTNDGVWHLLP